MNIWILLGEIQNTKTNKTWKQTKTHKIREQTTTQKHTQNNTHGNTHKIDLYVFVQELMYFICYI